MAYMNQEKKAKIAAALKLVVPKSWKYSLSVDNHSTIVMVVKSAPVDIIGETAAVKPFKDIYDVPYRPKNISVNPYHYQNAFMESKEVIGKIMDCLNMDNHDNSDIMTDYFDVGHYVELKFGKWDQPFVVA